MEATGEVEVRVLQAADAPVAECILEQVYDTGSARTARRRLVREPEEWLIAERDGSAAGVIASTVYGPVAYVNMLAVAAEHRRHHVATLLVTALLQSLEARGVTTQVLDATESAAPLYRAMGFRQIDRTAVYEDPDPPPSGDPAPSVTPEVLERLLELDAHYCGCDRSVELRRFAGEPYAFAAVEADGYIMLRGAVLGPFAAGSFATAERLLRLARGRRPAAFRALPPGANADAGPLLERFGFRFKRSLRHMVRGAPSPFAREHIFSQASLGHG